MTQSKPGGTGVYDDVCAQALLAARGSAAVLIVFNGKRGDGFSLVATSADVAAIVARALPKVLRETAMQLEADNAAGDGSWSHQHFRRRQ